MHLNFAKGGDQYGHLLRACCVPTSTCRDTQAWLAYPLTVWHFDGLHMPGHQLKRIPAHLAVVHHACLRSMRYHTVHEPGKGLEIETHKDTQTKTQVILETGMPQECPLYCVQGQLI